MDDAVDDSGGWPKIIRKNNSSVDTSRPFNSVKEAVAIFGERILVPGIYHLPPPPPTAASPSSWKSASASASPFNNHSSSSSTPANNNNIIIPQGPNDDVAIMESVKRLEAELEETKAELKLLKERGCETEIALASLNAELHKNMSKLALAEAGAARKAADDKDRDLEAGGGDSARALVKMAAAAEVNSPSLAQILNLGAGLESGGYYSNFGWNNINNNKMSKAAERDSWTTTNKKKKPIVPLVGDLLWMKKKKNKKSDHNNPLYGSPDIF